MERLPFEIQCNVFDQLDLNDKLTCLVISKCWNHIIKNTSFFSKIYFKNDKKFRKALHYFSNNKEYAEKVVYIKVGKCFSLAFYAPLLPTLFPNVRTAILSNNASMMEDILSSRDKETTEQELFTHVSPIINKWENLNNLYTSERIGTPISLIDFIMHSSYQNLTHIDTGIVKDNGCKEKFIPEYFDIVDCLKHAPNLESLTLNNMGLTFHELEKLHNNAPRLKSLILFSVKIFRPSTTNSQPIYEIPETQIISNPKPVQLDSFSVYFSEEDIINIDFETGQLINDSSAMNERILLDFILYIANKYTGLKVFTIKAETTGNPLHNHFDVAKFQENILPIFSRSPDLHTYQMIFCPLSSAITNEMYKHNINLKTLYLDTDLQHANTQFCALLTPNPKIERIYIDIQDQPRIDMFEFDNEDSRTPVDNISKIAKQMIEPLKQIYHLKHLHIHTCLVPGPSLLLLTQYLNEFHSVETIEYNNTFIPSNLYQPISFAFDTCYIKHLNLSSIQIYSLDCLKSLDLFFENLFSRCHHLETLDISLYLDEIDYDDEAFEQSQEPLLLTLALDLRFTTKLNSVKLMTSDGNDFQYYFITRSNDLGSEGYYFQDTVEKKFLKVNKISKGEFYIKILLDKPILLNSICI